MNDDRIEPQRFDIDGERDGKTLAAVVREQLPGRSWNQVRGIVSRGHVLTDGVITTDPAARVKEGQSIELSPRAKKAETRMIELLHFDRDVVVVDKPAGLISVPFSGERDTLLHLTTAALRRRIRKPSPMLRVVQRLDIDTTGVMVFARTKSAERHLQQQFRVHSVDRRYRALVLGRAQDATYDSPIVRNRGDGLRGRPRRGSPKGQGAKEATTHVQVLDVFDVPRSLVVGGESLQVSYVECRLETGRQHQIRIHLSEAGHPLVGEKVYIRDYQGPGVRGFSNGQGRPLLHAARLGFEHPSDGGPQAYVRPLPSDFETLLDQLVRADPQPDTDPE
jgi:23S rRNA pseudouridine1911/1915/1917 synthase